MREKNRRSSTNNSFNIMTKWMLPLNHFMPLPEPELTLLPELLTGMPFDRFPDFLRMDFAFKANAKVSQSEDYIKIVFKK